MKERGRKSEDGHGVVGRVGVGRGEVMRTSEEFEMIRV